MTFKASITDSNCVVVDDGVDDNVEDNVGVAEDNAYDIIRAVEIVPSCHPGWENME